MNIKNPYSPPCEVVLRSAQLEAAQYKHRYIHTEYLLLGLLHDKNAATQLLEELGHSVGQIKKACQSECKAGDHILKRDGVRLTSRALAIIDRAEAQQKAFGHSEVDTRHILLGILLESEGIAGNVLRRAGVSYEKARAAILDERVSPDFSSGTMKLSKQTVHRKTLWQFLSRA